jgi:hypothetical protein
MPFFANVNFHMSVSLIPWRSPWRAIQFAADIPGVQAQLEIEITPKHPLFGRSAIVVGRRIDCDDVLVTFKDDTYANVHLVWGRSGDNSGEYPSWFPYGGLPEFVTAMNGDAEEYGNES